MRAHFQSSKIGNLMIHEYFWRSACALPHAVKQSFKIKCLSDALHKAALAKSGARMPDRGGSFPVAPRPLLAQARGRSRSRRRKQPAVCTRQTQGLLRAATENQNGETDGTRPRPFSESCRRDSRSPAATKVSGTTAPAGTVEVLVLQTSKTPCGGSRK